MSKRSPIIRRRRYAIAGGQRPLTGADVEADFQEFHAPTSQLASSHFAGPGVIEGLSVTGETGGGKVVVAPGVAVDAQGRLIVLSSPPGNPGAKSYAHIGEVSAGGGIQPAERVEIPVDLPLASVAGKDVLVTIEHYEGIVDDGTPYDIKELQPWIRLRPVDELDGTEVVLAFLQVDADGTIAMFGPAPILKPGRNEAGIAVGAITMRCAVRNGGEITEKDTAQIFSTSNGIGIEGAAVFKGDVGISGTSKVGDLEAKAIIGQTLDVGHHQSRTSLVGNMEVREIRARQIAVEGQSTHIVMYDALIEASDISGPRKMQIYPGSMWIGEDGASRVSLRGDHGQGELILYDRNNQPTVRLSGDNAVKNAIFPYESDLSKRILYTCIEGPEVAAYCRGRGSLRDGHAQITFSDHFKQVVNVDTTTIQLTPRSAASKGLAVVGQSAEGFSVCELGEGTGTYDFDYFVTGVRRGHEAFEAVVNADTFALDDDNKGDDTKSPSAKEPPR